MTVLAPEFLQTTKYSAQRMRQMQAAGGGPLQEGIVNFGDFNVRQRGAGANMSVDVTAGDAWVQGDNTARQGLYHVGNDATINVAIPAAHATLPRVDQVVLRIYDSTVIGGEKDLAAIEVVSGTATAAATLSNLTGAAALPASAVRLAYVHVPALDTTIETAQIGNLVDPRRGLTGYPATVAPLALAGAPPQYAMGRPAGYVPAAFAYTPVAQNYLHGIGAPLGCGSEYYDNEGMHDLVTNKSRLTCQTPGLYSISGNVEWGAQIVAQISYIFPLVNGAGLASAAGRNSMNTVLNISTAIVYRLGYGDYVETGAQQNSGGTLAAIGSVQMHWMGP